MYIEKLEHYFNCVQEKHLLESSKHLSLNI